MVRAAHGRPAISSSIYFLLADYSYQHPRILVKNFIGLDIFAIVGHKSRGKNINDGETFSWKSTWIVRGSC